MVGVGKSAGRGSLDLQAQHGAVLFRCAIEAERTAAKVARVRRRDIGGQGRASGGDPGQAVNDDLASRDNIPAVARAIIGDGLQHLGLGAFSVTAGDVEQSRAQLLGNVG